MSKKKKSYFNWYFVLAGVLILYFGITRNVQEDSLNLVSEINAELSADMINIKGRRKSVDYKFWTKEYKSQFIILNGSVTRGRHSEVSELKKGKKIRLSIKDADLEKLNSKKNEITVHGLSVENKSLLTSEEFTNNRNNYSNRLLIFAIFVGIMLLLNGIVLIPNRTNYIIIGGAFGLVLLMRILEFGIY